MRDAFDALERSGHAWYLTGSEALAAYGAPRQTLDPGRVILEAILAGLGPDERARISVQLRDQVERLAWDQLDRAGPMSEIERALLLLDRLAPELPPAHREQLRRQMETDLAGGRWSGFRRPGSG